MNCQNNYFRNYYLLNKEKLKKKSNEYNRQYRNYTKTSLSNYMKRIDLERHKAIKEYLESEGVDNNTFNLKMNFIFIQKKQITITFD